MAGSFLNSQGNGSDLIKDSKMFMYRGRNKKVRVAVNFSNILMQNHEGFFNKVKLAQQFANTETSNEDIMSFMQERFLNEIQEVKVSRMYNPFGSVKASFSSKRPNQIRLNAWNLGRDADSITGSIIHEFVHLVDNFYKNAKFGHTYHNHAARKHSAPYAIGYIAKQHCMETID